MSKILNLSRRFFAANSKPKNVSAKNIPQRTVVISDKKGKAVVQDEFIGSYVRRESFFELISNIIYGLGNNR